jgi:antitoxin (DNA-binding transcriptional repressor) of toxin-antitoxin stability system
MPKCIDISDEAGMVPRKLTEADLETRLTEVLERVRHGERFSIERDGVVIGEIVPISEKACFTVRELADELFFLPPIDDDFGADVRMARMFRVPSEPPKWPD